LEITFGELSRQVDYFLRGNHFSDDLI